MIAHADNTRRLLLTTLILLLSGLACALPALTTVPDNTDNSPAEMKAPALTTPTTSPESVVRVVKVTADALHVRQQPGVKALVIGYLYAGDQVTWTGSCSAEPPGWAEIAYLDGLAWVNARYLDKNICSEAK